GDDRAGAGAGSAGASELPELGGVEANPLTLILKPLEDIGFLDLPRSVSGARKPNKTGQNTAFGGKESRNKSRNDSAVREPFYINASTRRRYDACPDHITNHGECKMTLRELALHQRAYRLGYHLCRRGTGYVLESISYGDAIDCPDLDALERCVANELGARNADRLAAACEGRAGPMTNPPVIATARRAVDACLITQHTNSAGNRQH
ncbi:MAG TPA: hypothetical protein VK210_08470, partial [Terriglobia bacterium]|nr:hypothetical protein [Terriglobia bacterium]